MLFSKQVKKIVRGIEDDNEEELKQKTMREKEQKVMIRT